MNTIIKVSLDTIVLLVLIRACIYDIKTRIIPHYIWILLLCVGLINLLLNYSLFNAVSSVGFSIVVFFIMNCDFCLMGGADILIMTCMALYLGLIVTAFVFIIAGFLCCIYARLKRNNIQPFVPFLATSYSLYLVVYYTFYIIENL